MKKIPTVYLAGAMTHAFQRGEAWRDAAAKFLAPEIGVLDPCKFECKEMTPKEIVALDYGAILNSQGLLLDARDPSWGTAMEIAFARQHGIPVVAWGMPTRSSPWLKHHVTLSFATLEGAIDVLKATLDK